jgi:hypothetical protein
MRHRNSHQARRHAQPVSLTKAGYIPPKAGSTLVPALPILKNFIKVHRFVDFLPHSLALHGRIMMINHHHHPQEFHTVSQNVGQSNKKIFHKQL